MMPEQFTLLNINDRANFVWDKGEYIGFRAYYGYKRVLYLADGLYIEVWYFLASNTLEKVELIENQADLEKYVDLDDIMREVYKPEN